MVSQMAGHHAFLGGGTEKRLLDRRRHRIDDGDGWLTDEVDDSFRESTHHDVYDSFLECSEIMNVNDVGNDDSQDGGGESTQEGEEIDPRGGAPFDSDVLTD